MKKLFFLIVFFSIFSQSKAQIFFGPENPISNSSIAQPEYFDASDFDGDGDLDALIVSRGTESLTWQENLDGLGNFGDAQILARGMHQPSNSIGVDLDGDGDNDIVSAVWGSDELFWLENLDGLGNFSDKIMIDDNASGIWRVRTADIDGDGDQDLLTAEREGNNIIWYENTDGNGSFSTENFIFIGPDEANLRDAFPVDMDNDGDVDVVTVDWFLKILGWHENTDGVGSFSDRMLISDKVDDINIVFCPDFDGDGYHDILARDRTEVFWIKNTDGGTTFSAPRNISQGETVIDYFTSDFDGDNDVDLLVSNGYFGNLGWFPNNGQGVFGPLQIIPNNIGGGDFIHAADLDGDGDQDFIGMSWSKSWVYYHENEDGNGLTQFPKFIAKAEIAGPYDMVLSDMNGDNNKEILLASRYEHKLYMYEGMSRDGAYGPIMELPGFVLLPSSIFAADIDGDAKKDFLAASFDSGKFYWSRNMGNNQFGLPTEIGSIDNSATDVFAADMDGDGDNDVLGTSLYTNKMKLFENDGNGNFVQELTISDNVGGAYDVIAVDLDGDNDMDVVCASRYADKISWFENMGSLNFSTEKIIDGDMNGTRKVISADIDGDGDEDIIASAWDKLLWYENMDGRNEFSEGKNIKGNDYLRDVNDIKAVDIDNDGDLDVFCVSESNNNITWYLNVNNGAEFIKQIDVVNGLNEPVTVGFDDVDRDGRRDVLVASFRDNKIGWYRSELYPEFSQHPQDLNYCQSGEATFSVVADKSDSYQWQVSWPFTSWFENIPLDDDRFSDTETANLKVSFEDNNLNMARFRCVITYLGAEFVSEPGELSIDQFIEAFAGDDAEICTIWAYLNANGSGIGTGLWSVEQGSGVFDDPADNYTQVNQVQSGTNVYKWTITNGTCVSEDEVTIIKHDSLFVQLPFDSLELNNGDQAEIALTTTGDVLTYQWYKSGSLLTDDGHISGSTTNKLTIDAVTIDDEGRYNCAIDGTCNYKFTDDIYLSVLTVGTEDTDLSQLKLFPNPAKDVLYVTSEKKLSEYQLFNSAGKLLKTEQINNSSFQIDLKTFIPGTYFIQVTNDKERILKQFIIE